MFEALYKLQHHFLLFLVSNQSGIGKGIIKEIDVVNINNFIRKTLIDKGITIYDVYYCPHITDDNCICKKPSPYFLNFATEKYHIDRSRSFMLGDHPSDVECGINAGVKSLYVLTGHGRKHLKELKDKSIHIFENILEAAKYILTEKK